MTTYTRSIGQNRGKPRRAAVEQEKHRLRAYKWWHRFIPVITITWRTK